MREREEFVSDIVEDLRFEKYLISWWNFAVCKIVEHSEETEERRVKHDHSRMSIFYQNMQKLIKCR